MVIAGAYFSQTSEIFAGDSATVQIYWWNDHQRLSKVSIVFLGIHLTPPFPPHPTFFLNSLNHV